MSSPSSFSRDSMAAPNLQRRSSFDFTQQDSRTLLDSQAQRQQQGVGRPGTFTSTRPPPQTQQSHSASQLGGGSPAAGPESQTRIPLDALRRAATGPTHSQHPQGSQSSRSEYRSLGSGSAAVHFEDVLREKSSLHLLPDQLISRTGSGLRITVTGELLDKKTSQRAKCEPTSTSILPPVRRRNVMTEDDEKEGSTKVFTSLEDFLKDEERRRAKYDAAVAAHQKCMEEAAESQAQAAKSSALNDNQTESSASENERVKLPQTSSFNVTTSDDSSIPPTGPHGSEPLAQTPIWISVEDSSDETTELIGRYFGLHPLTIEDCQSHGIREKLEVFPDYLFLVFHALEESSIAHVHTSGKHHHHQHGNLRNAASSSSSTTAAPMSDLMQEIMKTTPLKLVVFPSLVLSFHKGGLGSVLTVRKQLGKLYRNRVLNTAWLIHGLLDVVSDSLMPVVDTAAKEADDMEDLIYIINPGRESHKDVLKRMGFIARRLTFLRQRLWSKRDILTSLIEKDWQFFLTGVKVPYLRDIYDHLVIMLHKLDSAIEVIVTLQSTYLAVVSIDVAAVSNDGNKAMKTLSAAATIILPLSLIASLMGMNVFVPWDSAVAIDGKSPTWKDLMPFSLICIMMVLVSYYLYMYFKKKKYL